MTFAASENGVHQVDLELHPNEASDLLPLESHAVLDAHGWDAGFYTVLDEGVIEDCVAVLGHAPGEVPTEGWESHRLRCRPSSHADKTEDAEAAGRKDGWVYLIGSHYGSKTGPLEAKRAFLARFREADLTGRIEDVRPELQIARDRFAVHRAVNDALAAADVEPIALTPEMHEAFIVKTIELGDKKEKRWAGRVREGDWPLNIEAASFSPWGSLLLGLRYPCTADGNPICVELREPERLFDGDAETDAVAGAVWTVRLASGPTDPPVGFRAMTVDPDSEDFHAIFGSLDALGKRSALVDSDAQAGQAFSAHWRFALPEGGGETSGTLVREFGDERRVEGLAVLDGHSFYVVDEDERVAVRFFRMA